MGGNDFLEKLLDGVQVDWRPLGEVAENLDSMRKPITSGLRESGEIPYYGASGVVDYVNGYIFDGDFLLVSEDGANLIARTTPIAFSISGKSWVNNHAHVLKFRTYSERKFVEYYLNSVDLTPHITGAAQPKLNKKNLENIRIPNPSVTLQAQIVEILDTFSELAAELNAELTAELTARKQQYNHYREQLLTFEEGEVEWKPLGQLVTIRTGSKPNHILDGVSRFDYINAGTSRSGYCKESNCEGDTVTTPSRGQGGIGFVGYQADAFWLGALCYGLQSHDNGVLINKFLYYYLKCNSDLLLNLKKDGGVPAINIKDLSLLRLPIPSLAEQARIVDLLDVFDARTSSLSEGLPHEIELRQKQYAYYRELLYAFPKDGTSA
jgi:type I restriction enzyme S subunit